MNNPEKNKKIEEIFEELCLTNNTIPIIVEGLNDESALRQIGANGLVIRLNTGLSILNFCEQVAKDHEEVILLPDWDKKGKQLFKRLKQNFRYTRVRVIEKFWKDLKKFCSKEISEVENLLKFLDG